MSISREIFVSIMLDEETYPVGKLWFYNRKGRESALFEYNREWLSNPHRFALEPALLLSKGQFYRDKALFGAISDSAPDRWGRVLMRRANDTGRTLSEIDYLLGVSDEIRQGALRFSEKEDGAYLSASDGQSIPPIITLPELLVAAENFIDDTESLEQLKLLLAPGASLGGARPKASVIDKDGNYCIAKFPRKDDDTDVVRWEAVALTLAKQAGINIPEWKLINILDKPVLIVKRFDRVGKNRIPYLSAMSLIGATNDDGLVHSYVEIANAIVQNSAEPNKDLEELWRRMVFGVIISNTDDHLRNHGFLYNNKGWRLSPAFDLNPNIERTDFATPIEESGARNTIELAMKIREDFRIDNHKALNIINEVKEAILDWRKIAKATGINANGIERMRKAFFS
jgi:serine/threonine-protein kinase HipA